MSLINTKLSFDILNSYSTKTLVLLDTSFYSPNMTITGNTLQVQLPDRSQIQELSYTQNGVTVLNSNNLGITSGDIGELPDGVYTAKISICPYDLYWFEKTWYRTDKLECLYYQALLKLDINSCSDCFSPENLGMLATAKVYIEGVKANMYNNNIAKATELYKVASRILDEVINCDCSNKNRGFGLNGGNQVVCGKKPFVGGGIPFNIYNWTNGCC